MGRQRSPGEAPFVRTSRRSLLALGGGAATSLTAVLGSGMPAARAEKDGHTLFFGAVHHAIAPGVYPKLAYDIEKDFQPIAVVAVVPQVVVVDPDRVEAETLGELVDAAKSSPGSLTYG